MGRVGGHVTGPMVNESLSDGGSLLYTLAAHL